MLLTEAQQAELVQRLTNKAQEIINTIGIQKTDQETGLVHSEAHLGNFLMVEHQRQQIKTGYINTNGLDLWILRKGNAKKVLSVHYIPFKICFFDKAGKAPWIQELLDLSLNSRRNQPSN